MPHAVEPSLADTSTLPLSLDLVAGPEVPAFSLAADKVHVVGRSSTCDVQLPDKSVSRNHAQIRCRGGTWQITDLGSKHGSFLNGVRLEPNEVTPVRPGDLLSIDPWTLRARIGGSRPEITATNNDMTVVTQRVTAMPVADLATLAQQRLALLIDAAATIQAATNEKDLSTVVLGAAMQGTGFARAAVVRTTPEADAVEVIAVLPEQTKGFSFSRSLIRGASTGEIVTLSQDGGPASDLAISIVSLNIESAVCAPIYLGNAIDAYLYLDAREGERAAHSQSAAFCKALARMYGTALGNIKRLEVERMRGQLRAELEAAGVAQSFILPQPTGSIGRVRYSFRSRPGRFASGDLFDAVEMPGGRVGVFLGDVSGKGAAAAIVMAVAQTHLRGLLSAGMPPADAVSSLNRYIAERNREGQFITLWLGVFDPAGGSVEAVDAGHGYWMTRHGEAAPHQPELDPHLVVGVDPDYVYTSARFELRTGTRVVVCSDGVIEQCSPAGEQFGRDRAVEAFSRTKGTDEDVETLVRQVLEYAATDALSDDVTAASVECL